MSGIVYVLVNSSLPRLVKVGKTTRDPHKRAAELSASTGVPTPFIVAYSRQFSNVDLAEKEIHSRLSNMKKRVSKGREFFIGDASEIIDILLRIPSSNADSLGEDYHAADVSGVGEAPEFPFPITINDSILNKAIDTIKSSDFSAVKTTHRILLDLAKNGCDESLYIISSMGFDGTFFPRNGDDLSCLARLSDNGIVYADAHLAYHMCGMREKKNFTALSSNFMAYFLRKLPHISCDTTFSSYDMREKEYLYYGFEKLLRVVHEYSWNIPSAINVVPYVESIVNYFEGRSSMARTIKNAYRGVAI